MGQFNLHDRSDIFGITTTSQGNPPAVVTLSATPTVGEMLQYIKSVSDQNLSLMASAAEWMGAAAKQGQNETGKRSLVGYGIEHPDPNKPTRLSDGYANWALTSAQMPPMPSTLPNMDQLPAALKIDFQKIDTDMQSQLAKLKDSWIMSFMPPTTEDTNMSQLYTMLDKVLDGTYYSTMDQTLKGYEDELKSTFKDTFAKMKTSLDTNLTKLQADLGGRITGVSGLDARSASALALATDNTQNIAWARARDQAAAEAVRAESEAATLWASRGFAIPPGALTYQSLTMAQGVADAALVAAGDQAVRAQQLYFDVAQKNLDAWITATNLYVQTDIENYKAQYTYQMAQAQMETEQNRLKIKQAVDYLGLKMEYTKFTGDLAVKYRLGVNNAMAQLVNAYAQYFRNQMEYSVQMAAAQRAFWAALIDYYRMAIQTSEFVMKATYTDKDLAAKYAEIAANFIVNSVGHHVQAANATGNMYANVAGMAVNNMIGMVTQAA